MLQCDLCSKCFSCSEKPSWLGTYAKVLHIGGDHSSSSSPVCQRDL
ncbi:hypothetical protein Hdeb2414_s0016g00470801 [Helianthus debilis subsp. tardiflorus]